jgi:hypothetical protein
MNFVVAALILARFHDLSPLAASSESANVDSIPPDTTSPLGSPDPEVESEIFWLFQVIFLSLSLRLLTFVCRASCRLSNQMAPSPRLLSASPLPRDGIFKTGRSSPSPPFGRKASPK